MKIDCERMRNKARADVAMSLVWLVAEKKMCLLDCDLSYHWEKPRLGVLMMYQLDQKPNLWDEIQNRTVRDQVYPSVEIARPL